MPESPSVSRLLIICLCVLGITASTSCRHGEQGKWVFQSSDGMRIERNCSLCTASDPWVSHLPRNATGTLQLILSSGQMVGEYQLSNGVQHGVARLWNAKGQRIMDATYLHGRLDGLYTTWHDNGIKTSEGMFREGREVGWHLAWYETGGIKTEAEYMDGVLNGRYRTWMQDGEIVSDGIYSNMWPQSGTVILEWVEGKPPIIGIYRNGALVDKRQWQKH